MTIVVLEKIRRIYPQLTRSQRRLADFVATSYRQAAFMTASRLAKTLAINEATVIRFAQRLGYPGFPQLIQDVQAVVRDELGGMSEAAVASRQDPFLALLDSEVESLRRTVTHISPDIAREAVAALVGAQHIYVLGQGLAASLAQLFSLSLRTLGISSENPPADPLSLSIMLSEVDQRFAVVGISVGMESQETANALEFATQRGARTLALTGSPLSPCAQAAERAISCPTDDSLVLPSVTSIAMIIDALVQTIGSRDVEGVRTRAELSGSTRDQVLSRHLR